jgi:hypothetical protein
MAAFRNTHRHFHPCSELTPAGENTLMAKDRFIGVRVAVRVIRLKQKEYAKTAVADRTVQPTSKLNTT